MHATVLSVAMVMLTGHLLYGHPMQSGKVRNRREKKSISCPAGTYMKYDGRCEKCRDGFFTNQANREDSCIRCYQSCSHEFNKVVIKKCTSTSDVVCQCQKGYYCIANDEDQCSRCDPYPTTEVPYFTTTEKGDSSTEFNRVEVKKGTTTSKNYRCQEGFICTSEDTGRCIRCDPISTTLSTMRINSSTGIKDYVWILAGFISATASIIIFMLFLRIFSKKEKECFKKLARQCSVGADVDGETTPPSQQDELPHVQEVKSHISSLTNQHTYPFHQPVSQEQAVPPAGNLGPLHIYNPHTVFVSLLNRFGGEQKSHEPEESLNNSNESYPQSPPVHLSEEERSTENDFIFFPSQEQGKECHISKEEVL